MTLALGVDIGGSRLRVALVTATGQIIARAETATAAEAGPEAVIAQIRALAGTVRPEAGSVPIAGAGVSCPGPLDTTKGHALGVPTLRGWVNIPIAKMIGEALNLSVVLENDGIAAAHGEWRFGAGRGQGSLVFITVSTGIGGGVVLDNRLVHGRKGMAGHVGHMVIVADGAPCPCGNRGCFEAYASGTAFAARIRATDADASPADIFARARSGDEKALSLVAEEADWLGLGLVSLLHLYSPDVIVVGGGVSNGLDLLLPGIRGRIGKGAMPAFRDVPVVRAGLGENAGLVGAAALVLPAA